MNWNNLIQISFYLAALLLAVKPLGTFMASIYEEKPAGFNTWLGSLERCLYRVCGVRADVGMTWKEYAVALMLFNALGDCSCLHNSAFPGFFALEPHGVAGSSRRLGI